MSGSRTCTTRPSLLAFKIHGETAKCCRCNTDNDCTDNHNTHGVKSYDPQTLLDDADKEDIDRVTDLDRILYVVAKERLRWEIEYIRRHHDEQFLTLCAKIG